MPFLVRRSLLTLVLAVAAPAALAAGPARRALVSETRLVVRPTPGTGLLRVEADLAIAPAPGEAGDVLLLRLRDDMELVRVSGALGYVETRQGGGLLRLLVDPPLREPARVHLVLDGAPTRPPTGERLVGPGRLLLPPDADWYPRGDGKGRVRLAVDLPAGWTALGTGLGLGDDGRPAFFDVDAPPEGAWLFAEPGLAVRTARTPVALVLAGPADEEPLVIASVERTARALGALRDVLGPLPGLAVVLAGVRDLDAPLDLPGAFLVPFERLRDDLEAASADLTPFVRTWWGGLVRPSPDEDPRWLAGFAAGLAAEIARETGGPRPRDLAALADAYVALPPDRRVALARAGRRAPDAAVIVPAAGILQSFAVTAGREAFHEAVRAATERHARRSVGLAEFAASLEQGASMRTPFFAPWLERPGPADLRVTWDASPVGEKWDVLLEVHQEPPAVPLSVEVLLSGPGPEGAAESLDRVLHTAEVYRAFPLRLRFQPSRVEADPRVRLFRWTATLKEKAHRVEYLLRATRLAEEAAALLDEGLADEAAPLLEEALGLDPRHPQAVLGKARVLLAERKVEASRALLLPVAREPLGQDYGDLGWVRAWAEVLLGRGYDVRRDRTLALDAYRRALKLPDGRRAHEAARAGIDAPFVPAP